MRITISVPDKHIKHAAAALIAIAFCAGVFYSVRLGSALRYPDEKWYATVAGNLASKHMYSRDGVNPTAYRPPVYPLLLAAVNKLGGGIPAYRGVNMLAFAGCLVLVFRIAARESGPRAGLIAVLMALCYPVLLYTAGTLYPQTVGALILLTIVWLLLDKEDGARATRILLAGILAALAALTVPGFLFLVPFLPAWLLVRNGRRSIPRIAVLLAAVAMIFAPWVVRNYRVFGFVVPVSTNTGYCLVLGNAENTTPNSNPGVDFARYNLPSKLNEAEIDRFLTGEAIRFVRTHPWRSARMYTLKFLNYFNYRNELQTREQQSATADTIMLLTYGALLALALVRLLCLRRIPLTRFEWFVYTFYVSYGAWCAVTVARIRYRLPADFLLILVCALFVSRLVSARPIGPSPKTQL